MLRVLTFSWEFAPVLSGGLGIACAGLGKALAELGVGMTFVLPRLPRPIREPGVEVLAASDFLAGVETRTIKTLLTPYLTATAYQRTRTQALGAAADGGLYGPDLFAEVERYAEAASKVAAEVRHDVIHCHDWMTYEAGIRARRISGRPLVVHVHSTEFDRSGGHGANPEVYAREHRGFRQADRIVAVSQFTKRKLVEHYGVDPDRVLVVHNAIDHRETDVEKPAVSARHRVVLFLGRVTIQKGPDWFVYAARRVLEKDPDVLFVIAGSGDMEPYVIDKVTELGLSRRVLFTGFLRDGDVDRAYRMADVYVMPSVSEPFGIAPLEAMQRGTPVIISKQSGVSEVVRNCFKVDFWDTEELAGRILGLLRYRELHAELAEQGRREVGRLSWRSAANRMLEVYQDMIPGSA